MLSVPLPLATVLLVLASFVSGCLQSKSISCADGLVCPQGTACHAASGSCATPEQIAACAGGELECAIAGVAGQCVDGLCLSYTCGDGVVTAPEQCEAEPLDVAGATCASLGFYQGTDVACTPVCTLDFTGCTERCGDQIVNGPEECEVGFPGAGRNCVDLAGGDFFDVGLQSCSSLCSLREDNCQSFGWRQVSSGSAKLIGLWSANTGEVYAVTRDDSGIGGTLSSLSQFVGGSWVGLTTPPPGAGAQGTRDVTGALWGAGPSDLWFGYDGGLSHWDGNSRLDYDDLDKSRVLSISGTAANSVFALTELGNLYKFAGQSWELQVGGIESPRDVFARDANRAFVVGRTIVDWDDGVLTAEAPVDGPFAAIHGFSPDDVWALGETGTGSSLLHFDGTSWTEKLQSTAILRDLGGDARHAIAVGDSGTAFFLNSGSWIELPPILFNDIPLNLTGTACHGDNLFGTGLEIGTQFQWAGYGFASAIAVDDDSQTFVQDLWVQDKQEWVALARQQGSPAQFVGVHNSASGQRSVPIATGDFKAIWGSAADNVYAVGTDPALQTDIYRFDGTSWSSVDRTLPGLYATIDGSGPDNIWLAGPNNSVAHFDGSSWMSTPPADDSENTNYTAIYAAAPSLTFLGSQNGEVFIHDGSTWTQSIYDVAASAGRQITAIDGSGPNDIWVLTNTDTFYHYDASRVGDPWQAYPQPGGPNSFTSMVAIGPDEVFAFGSAVAAHFDGEGWASLRSPINVKGADGVSGAVFTISNAPKVTPFLWSRRWACKASETSCANTIDDDCDGAIDAADSDC